MADQAIKEVRIEPLGGGMDTRTPSGVMDFGSLRLCLNMDGSEWGSPCRMGGFRKYLGTQECYQNQDLHDQLLGGQTYYESYTVDQAGWSAMAGYSWAIWPPYQASYPVTFPSTTYSDKYLVRVTNTSASVAIVYTALGGAAQAVLAATDGSNSLQPGQSRWYYVGPAAPGGLSFNQVAVSIHFFGGYAVSYSSTDTLDIVFDGSSVVGTYGSITVPGHTETFWTTSPYQLPIYQRVGAASYDYCGGQEYLLGRQCREAITMLHSFSTDERQRRLLAATKSRLYVSDESGGNWRILADGLGGSCMTIQDCICSTTRMTAASLGERAVFTNGTDYVMSWRFDDAPSGCAHWSADYIQELLELNIDSAQLVASWGGFVFLGAVSADGQLLPHRFIWSDYNDPESWTPGGESLAGYHDFAAGERILAWGPIGGRFRIYTTRAVYDITISESTDLVFNVQEIYRSPSGSGLPVYRHSLVCTGDKHYYLSDDTIWVMSEYDREPTKFLWMHLAVGAIYGGVKAPWVDGISDLLPATGPINRSLCDLVTGGYDRVKKSVWFSWPSQGATSPDMSLVLWPATNRSTLYDHGFTAFVSHRPDLTPSIRDWMGDNHLCNPESHIVLKEGKPCSKTFTSGGFGSLFNASEDPTLPLDANSFMASVCGICIEQLCGDCDTDIRFIGASAEDKALKEIGGPVYYREIIQSGTTANFPDVWEATYVQSGYTSLMQGDSYRYKTASDKRVHRMELTFTADDQSIPGDMIGEIGVGSQAECLTWERPEQTVAIGECLDQPAADDGFTRQGRLPSWPFYARGQYVAWRVWTTGTGNQFCSSSLSINIAGIGNPW